VTRGLSLLPGAAPGKARPRRPRLRRGPRTRPWVRSGSTARAAGGVAI